MSGEKSLQIIETIASGGTAVLYKAVQTSLDRAVAVKKLHPHLTSDPNFTRRFILEAKAAASLDHENIVHVIDFGVEDDSYQIVMEYVEGESLKQIIEKWSPMPVDLALALTHQICLGLEHAHNKGIVHRDIKPGNILLTKYGRVKITDFGLAKLTQSKTQETAANSILGTPLYMSPEQAFGESVDARSDLFSLGTVLYEMLTGKQPFAGENYMGVIQNIINKSVPSPKRFNVHLPQPIESVLSRALSKNRDARFQSTMQFRLAIEDYIEPSRLKEAYENLKSLLITNGVTISMQAASRVGFIKKRNPKRRFAVIGSLASVAAAAALVASSPGLRDKIHSLIESGTHWSSSDTPVMEGNLTESGPFKTIPADSGTSSEGGPNGLSIEAADTSAIAGMDTAQQADSSTSGSEAATRVQTGGTGTGELDHASSDHDSSSTAAKLAEGEAGAGTAEKAQPKPKAVVRKGWLSVTAWPSAEIHVDGKYIGDTPPAISIKLTKGTHKLECKNPKYEPYLEMVNIVTGELSRREIMLKKLRGLVSLAATEGAEFYIDGKLIGVTPIMEPIEVDAGRHQFKLEKAGFHTWDSQIIVPAKEVLPLKITLSPKY